MKNALNILIDQFLSPLIYVLLIAAVACLAVQELNDALVIGIVIIINTILGFTQEWKAEKTAAALKSYEVQYCQVKRNDKIIVIESEKLVSGDIVMISAGSRIPADIKISYSVNFKVEEAILTGEPHPIEKKIDEIAYAGTYAVSGKAEGIVIATGTKTEFGQIATLVEETRKRKTPLQIKIKKLSFHLTLLILAIVTIIFFLGILYGMPLKKTLTISVALAVAAIPEGLMISMTVVLAIGMQRMLKRKALVRHLIAAETLGSVSVVCTDKTGTLTRGIMTATNFVTKKNEDLEELLIASVLNNDAQPQNNSHRIGNPTEIALLEAATKAGINIDNIRKKYPRISEIPFSADLKYMVTMHDMGDTKKIFVKGAPEEVLPMCENGKDFFGDHAKNITERGLRVIAIATGTKSKIEDLFGLKCLGLIGLQDPLREEAEQTIKQLATAGVKTVLVTGDNKNTAINIAKKAGIPTKNIISGQEMELLSEKDLQKKVRDTDIFARVEPKHKIQIVSAFQKNNDSVAMIGDGVNDTPALKAADISIAIGSGSDAAHEVSDMVLLDNNLSTVTAAVKEGRAIFDNIRKIIVYLMAQAFGEVVLIFGSMTGQLPLPLIATQILWINFISSSFPTLALTTEPAEDGVMKEKPRPKNTHILNKEMKVIIFIVGLITDLILFVAYITLLKIGKPLEYIRTILFTALSINSLFYVFSIKNMRSPIFKTNPFSNWWLNISVFVSAALQIAAIYTPTLQRLLSTMELSPSDWLIVIALALVKMVGIEIAKTLSVFSDNPS